MIKVLEVVGLDASEAARAQVSALCGGLDPAKYNVTRIDVAPAMTPSSLRLLFTESRPDVVHVHSPKDGARARASARAAGIKKVLHSPHGGLLDAPSSLAARALSAILGRGAGRIGDTIAASAAEAEAARRLGGSGDVHVVPDAYLGDFPEPLAHDDLIVGSCGRMTPARDADAWVLLVQRLCDSRNGVACVWIGGGEDEAKTRVNLTNMNLLMKVSLTGWLPAEQAREKLRGLDLFVQYAREGAAPGSVLDAMALGLPVVASDTSAHRDLVADGVTGFLVDSEMRLLERCQQLIDDEPLSRRLGAAGRDRVRAEFSRERMIADLSRLYSA